MPQIPTLARAVLELVARHILTALAGWLIANGMLASGQGDQLVNLGLGIVVGAAGMGWSYLQKLFTRRALVAALNAPPPMPPAK